MSAKARTNVTTTPTPLSIHAYDALTLDLERAETLVGHLAARLEALSNNEPQELYALSLIADSIHEKLALVREHAGRFHAKIYGGTR